jgi:hypothetical protein
VDLDFGKAEAATAAGRIIADAAYGCSKGQA